MTAPHLTPNNHDAGMTLLELVVAMALFALLAVMGLQSLSGTLRLRDHLAGTERQTADATVALALLRADLQAASPMLFHPPGGASASSLDPGIRGDRLDISLGGQPSLPGQGTDGFIRVLWRWDPGRGQLLRQVWPTLIPATGAALGPETIVASGISGLSVRIYSPNRGWTRGADPAVTGASSDLPAAVEVTVTTDRFGPITLLQAYQ